MNRNTLFPESDSEDGEDVVVVRQDPIGQKLKAMMESESDSSDEVNKVGEFGKEEFMSDLGNQLQEEDGFLMM